MFKARTNPLIDIDRRSTRKQFATYTPAAGHRHFTTSRSTPDEVSRDAVSLRGHLVLITSLSNEMERMAQYASSSSAAPVTPRGKGKRTTSQRPKSPSLTQREREEENKDGREATPEELDEVCRSTIPYHCDIEVLTDSSTM